MRVLLLLWAGAALYLIVIGVVDLGLLLEGAVANHTTVVWN
ncbi:MAG: hypothetical protein NZM28_10140 [Fimbriimonadales bacterium]|nr:hypothetical protein [Fimbriimonadales bacterium]